MWAATDTELPEHTLNFCVPGIVPSSSCSTSLKAFRNQSIAVDGFDALESPLS